MHALKRRNLFYFALIFVIPLSSGYIDPGTGGYLATSFFSSILTFLAIAFATIAAFFSRHIINPIKRFWKFNKKQTYAIFIVLIILITLIIINPQKNEFDPSLSGAHMYDIQKSYQGYNLYEGKLIDMSGNIIHNWSSIYMGTIDSNGDYYAQECYECPKWGRYSFSGEVIWEKDFPIHHNILLTPQNTIIVMGKEVHEYNGRMVEFDTILEYDKNGNLIQEYSLWNNLNYLKQFHPPLELDKSKSFFIPEEHKKNTSIWGGNYDYYHLNYVSVIPETEFKDKHSAFKPGNWLISFRHGSMLYILDKDTKEVQWYALQPSFENEIQGQHSPQMLPNGNILIFDNGRYRKWSRIISINPVNMQIDWEYKSPDFFTLSQGHIQILPNGNLLISETEEGRVFELTPDKEVVWEYYHPEQQNEKNSVVKEKFGLRQEISKMERYPKQFIDSLLAQNEK